MLEQYAVSWLGESRGRDRASVDSHFLSDFCEGITPPVSKTRPVLCMYTYYYVRTSQHQEYHCEPTVLFSVQYVQYGLVAPAV